MAYRLLHIAERCVFSITLSERSPGALLSRRGRTSSIKLLDLVCGMPVMPAEASRAKEARQGTQR